MTNSKANFVGLKADKVCWKGEYGWLKDQYIELWGEYGCIKDQYGWLKDNIVNWQANMVGSKTNIVNCEANMVGLETNIVDCEANLVICETYIVSLKSLPDWASFGQKRSKDRIQKTILFLSFHTEIRKKWSKVRIYVLSAK